MGDDNKISFNIAADGAVEAAENITKVAEAFDAQRRAVKAVDDAVASSDFGTRVAEYRTEADKLNVSQTQAVATLKQVTAESQRATAQIEQQSQAVQSSAAKFASFGEAAEHAIASLNLGDKTSEMGAKVASAVAEMQKALGAAAGSSDQLSAALVRGLSDGIKEGLEVAFQDALSETGGETAAILEKFKELEADKTSLVKEGLSDQRTEIEKQLGSAVDALRKRFEGANLGGALAGSGKEAVAALGTQLDDLGRKLAAVKAMDQAAEQSGFLGRMAAYKAEAAALNAETDKNAGALKKVANALADTTSGLETNTTKLRSQVGAGAGAISQLGQAFAQVVPEVAGFQNAIDVGLRSLGGMLGVLGGGPGIVLGGLVAGLGIVGAVMSSTKKEADELAKSTTANKEALEAYLDEIDKHKGQASTKSIDATNEERGAVTTHQIKVTGEAELKKALDSATASIAQYDTEITLLEKRIADNQEAMKLDVSLSWSELQKRSSVVIPQLKNENEGYREQIALLQQRRDVAKSYADDQKAIDAGKKELADALAAAGAQGQKAKTVDFNAPEPIPTSNKPRPDDASATQKRLDENLASINKLRDLQAAADDKRKAQEDDLLKYRSDNEIASATETIKAIQEKYALAGTDRKALLHTNLAQERDDIETQINTALDSVNAHNLEQTAQVEAMRREAIQETHQQFLSLEEEKAQVVQKHMQEEQSKRQQMSASLMALGTTAAQLAAKQLSEAVKGHKIQGAMILEGLGDAMVAEGVRVMFQGAAMSLMGNFASGGGLLALGAAEIGVGLGLGAAGAAAQPPTSTSGNGASTAPSSPIRDTQQTSNEQQRGPTVIYIDMPTVVSPSAEDGLRVRQAIDAASRVYGAPV